MIGLWMLYGVVVAFLLGGAAGAGERALRVNGRSARWAWVAALAGAWLVPFFTWMRRTNVPTPSAAPADPGGAADPAAILALLRRASELPRVTEPVLAPVNDVLPWVWVGLAATALAVFGVAVRRVLARSRRWPEARVQGQRVRLSRDFGPAVVGVRRPVIVLPRWILSLEAAAVGLVLRHEKEHRSARDTLLLTGGLLLVLLAPWNPGLWWLFRRLRMAVELDCDRRVLARGVSPRSYGDLLLRVGQRLGRTAVPAAALAEPPSFLERRLEMITETDRAGRIWKSAAGAALAGLLVMVACETPAPTTTLDDAVDADEAVEAVYQATEVADGAPLVLVDDQEREDGLVGLDGLDPGEIERIEVVKGGAARQIWGERGKYGVVKIFTKEEQDGGGTYEAVEIPAGEDAGLETIREVTPGVSREDGDGVMRSRGGTIALREQSSLGTGGRYRVRGSSTIRATAAPRGERREPGDDAPSIVRALPVPGVGGVPSLVIVDGEEFDDEMSSIDLDRIDRVEVLKGEAAFERYGEKGRTGAILITTKGGGA